MSDLHNQFKSELYNRFRRFREQMREQKGETITLMRVSNYKEEFIDFMKQDREDDSNES